MSQPTHHSARKLADILRTRNAVLGSSIFMPNAWDVLLTLHAHPDGLGCADLIEAVSGPDTVVSRWITLLEQEGLIDCGRTSPQAEQCRLTGRAEAAINTLLAPLAA